MGSACLAIRRVLPNRLFLRALVDSSIVLLVQ